MLTYKINVQLSKLIIKSGGNNAGLDLSIVNGLDLTSPHYEVLNLTQQCLNLSNGNNSSRQQQQQQPNSAVLGSCRSIQAKQQQQQQQQPAANFTANSSSSSTTAASELMVLNLSTQIGLNLTRPGQRVATTTTCDDEDDDTMDYMMSLDLAVGGHSFDAGIGEILSLKKQILEQKRCTVLPYYA